jgi:hypothetical protein
MQALLLFRREGFDLGDTEERRQAMFQRFVDWAADLDRRGKYVEVGPLLSGGKTVRRKGAGFVVDGPYAEGHDAVLGYFIIEVADMDEACALAGECPHTDLGGAVEVRQLGAFKRPR